MSKTLLFVWLKSTFDIYAYLGQVHFLNCSFHQPLESNQAIFGDFVWLRKHWDDNSHDVRRKGNIYQVANLNQDYLQESTQQRLLVFRRFEVHFLRIDRFLQFLQSWNHQLINDVVWIDAAILDQVGHGKVAGTF